MPNKDAATLLHQSFRGSAFFYPEVGPPVHPEQGAADTNYLKIQNTSGSSVAYETYLGDLPPFSDFYNKEFTVQCYMYFTTVTANQFTIFYQEVDANNNFSIVLNCTTTTNINFSVVVEVAGVTYSYSGSGATVGTLNDSAKVNLIMVVKDTSNNFYLIVYDGTTLGTSQILGTAVSGSTTLSQAIDALSLGTEFNTSLKTYFQQLLANTGVSFIRDYAISNIMRMTPGLVTGQPILYTDIGNTADDLISAPDSNYQFWVDFEDAGFADDSTPNRAVVNTNAVTQTTDNWYGTYAGLFNGTNQRLEYDNTGQNHLGISEDICFKFKLSSRPASIGLYGETDGTSANFSYAYIITGATDSIVIQSVSTAGTRYSATISGITAFAINTWYEFRLLRIGSRVYVMINGRVVGSTAYTAQAGTGGTIYIGYTVPSAVSVNEFYFPGVIDNFRAGTHRQNQNYYVNPWKGDKVKPIVKFTNNLSPSAQLLQSASFPSNIPDIKDFKNSLVVAGINPIKKLVNNKWRGLGFNTPPSAFGVTSPASGSSIAAGDYDYVITFVDENGFESGRSASFPSTAHTALAGDNLVLTLSTVTEFYKMLNDNVKYVRIYRRKTSAGESNWYFIAEVLVTAMITYSATAQNNFIYTDTTAQPDYTRSAPPSDLIRPYACNYVEPHNGRVYYGHVSDGRNKVYFSRINHPEMVRSVDYFFVGTSDSEPLTGMKSYYNNMIFFREKSIYLGIGNPEDIANYQIQRISNTIGCVSHLSIVQVESMVFFAHTDGIYVFNGRDIINISDDIFTIFRDMPKERQSFIGCSVDTVHGLLFVSLSESSETINDTILVFNYKEYLQDGKQRWYQWDVDSQFSSGGLIGTGRDYNSYHLTSETGVPKLTRFNFTAAYDSFLCEWVTGGWNEKNKHLVQHIQYVTAIISGANSSQAVKVGAKINGSEIVSSYTPVLNTDSILNHIGGRDNFVQLIFRIDTTSTSLKLLGFNLQAKPVGRR